MKGHIHSRIAKLLVVLALAVVASVMFVFVGCSSECEHEKTHTETVAATCTTAGSTKTVCDDCGETIKTEPIAALGHKWDEGKVVAATCAAGGYTLKTCTVCGTQQQVDLTEALPHAWKNTTTVEATCEKDGYTEQTCEACGATRRVNIVAAEGHKWVNKEVAATCGTAGRTYQECSVCGEIRNQVTIPATGAHDWVAGKTTDATCVVNGYTEYTCSGCGATKQEVTEIAEGHKWKKLPVLREEATCTTDGYTYTECENCDERQTIDIIPATGHTFVYDAAATKITAATCTTDGSITAKCHCGEVATYTAAQLKAMSEDDFEDLKIPEAVETQYTTANGFLFASGHNFISHNYENGYADTELEYKTAPAGGHDDELYQICENIGVLHEGEENEVDYDGYSLVCTYCDLRVETAAHTPDVTPAHNCVAKEEGGDVAWTCTVCDYVQNVTPHNYELKSQTAEGKWEADPIADSNGKIEYNCLNAQVCKDCGYVNANGTHKMPAADNEYYQANCLHGMLCVTCGKDVFGGKEPHKMVKMSYEATEKVNNALAFEPTCTTKGLDVYYCETCAELAADEEYPFEVTWTTLSKTDGDKVVEALKSAQTIDCTAGNFYTVETNTTDHTWVASKISNNPDDPTATLCTTDYWYIDHCDDCNKTRVEKTAAELTGNRKGTGDDAKYVTNDDGWYDPHAGSPTGHDYDIDFDLSHYVDEDGNKLAGMDTFELPSCSTNGWFVQTCINTDDAGHQCGLRTWVEVTLEDYIKAGQIDGVTSLEEALAKPEWHDGDMPACGEPVCNVCSDRDHGVQYVLTFEAHAGEGVPAGATLPTIPAYTNYYCLEDLVVEDGVKTEKGEVAQFIAMMEKLDADDAAYKYSYYLTYKDGKFSDEITDWAEMLEPKGNVSYSKNTTIYVMVTLEDGAEDTIFATGYNATARWINDNVSPNRTQYLDIEICIDTDVIAIDKVEGITVALKNAEGTAVAGAVCSTEAQLAAFVNSCNTVWYKNGSQQWIQVEEFCNKIVAEADKTANLDGVFTVWNTVEYKTCLDGYTLDITLKAGGVEFKSTVTITDTVEQIMVDGVLQINDIPNA